MTEHHGEIEGARNDHESRPYQRNTRLYDRWSNVHILSGIIAGWTLHPLAAFALCALYEPFEVFLLSPFLMKRGIVFGYEALPNSLSDIFFDSIGIAIGFFLALHLGRPQDFLLYHR